MTFSIEIWPWKTHVVRVSDDEFPFWVVFAQQLNLGGGVWRSKVFQLGDVAVIHAEDVIELSEIWGPNLK